MAPISDNRPGVAEKGRAVADRRNSTIHMETTATGLDISGLLDRYQVDPAAEERLRRLLNISPSVFSAVLETFRSRSVDSALWAFWLMAFHEKNFVEAFCSTFHDSPADAVSLFGKMVGYEPIFDLRLMVLLRRVVSYEANRHVLEVLDSLGEAEAVFRAVQQMLAESVPREQMKAAKNAIGTARAFREAHSRHRANALEALWGNGSQEARELLHEASRDTNNRVRANALFGLYQLDDTSSVSGITEMALSLEKLFRQSAVWVIGKTADQRFSELLLRLFEDPELAVRREAFKAMRGVKDLVAITARRSELRTKIVAVKTTGAARQAVVVVCHEKGAAVTGVPATAFVLRENGQPVTDYAVEESGGEQPVSLGFLMATSVGRQEQRFRISEDAISDLLEQKRPDDQFTVLKLRCGTPASEEKEVEDPTAVLHLRTVTAPREPAATEVPIVFESKRWILERMLARPLETANGSLAEIRSNGLRRLIAALANQPYTRHLACLVPDPQEAPSGVEELVALATAASVSVHVVAAGKEAVAPGWIQLAERTSGIWLAAPSMAAIRSAWNTIYHGISSHYLIRWTAPGTPAELSLRIFAEKGSGIAVWPERDLREETAPDTTTSSPEPALAG